MQAPIPSTLAVTPPKHFKPHPFYYHEVIELKIDTLTNLGLGLGRIHNWVVMVPFTLPGERVQVRIYKNHKNYSEGDLLEVLEASPHRVEPLCPLFGTCGGCQYQHLAYAEQLQHKQKQVKELLQHLAKLEAKVKPTRPSPKPYYYRSKLTPHFPAARLQKESPQAEGVNSSASKQELRDSQGLSCLQDAQGLQGPKGFQDLRGGPDAQEPLPIGFLKQGSRFAILDVPHCPIATEAINAHLPTLRSSTRENIKHYKRGGTLLLRDQDGQVCTDPKALLATILNTPSGKLKYQFVAGDFFQNNPFILEDLIHYTLGKASATQARYLIDAYCGVGVFALAGNRLFQDIYGIELSPMAVSLAQANAERNGITNCTFIQGKAETLFQDLPCLGSESVMIIDPPRKGCDRAFLEQVLQLQPKRLIYISCAPDTQARDIAYLYNGGYTLAEVQPFDLFPQTRHIENVATLDLKGE